jgi:transcriptional regulator with XRE-family HTH domain
LGPDEIDEILGAFRLDPRDLANALNVAPVTVSRWREGTNSPSGLQEEVLRALHNTAIELRGQADSERATLIRGLIILGIGALIFYLLSRR